MTDAATLSSSELSFVGDGLERPECVLALGNGEIWVSDRTRGVQRAWPAPAPGAWALGVDPARFVSNGIALLPDGSFLVANIGLDGGLWRLRPRGRLEPHQESVDGVPLAVTNFVLLDHAQRLWLSISTRRQPREEAFRRGVADGFVAVVADGVPRIVAEGLGFTNEVHVSPDGAWLYAHETVARRLSRYPIRDDSSLGKRETVIEYGEGIFPDGMAFDAEGGVWITSVVSNRLLRLHPNGTLQTIIDESDAEVIAGIEERFRAGPLTRADMDAGRNGVLGNLSSIAFGGADMRSAYLGSLFCTRVATFRSDVAGFALAYRSLAPDPDFDR